MIRLCSIRAAVRVAYLLTAAFACGGVLHAQEDGGVSHDSRGNILLESIYVPEVVGAPFSLMLAAEWTRPLMTGGSFTIMNARPIKRDSAGRIYQERWLMVPKGSNIKSTMSFIQIEDSIAGIYYECGARSRVCELHSMGKPLMHSNDPSQLKSGKLSNGKGIRTHEDKGLDTVAGVPVHAYRDTTVLNTGTLGNDSPMTYVRDVRYSPELGINLTSVLQSPMVGEQRFAVTEITTSEPESRYFQPPDGYRIVDMRNEDAKQP